MKKALFYGLVLGYGYPGLGRLMAVTSVKGTQLYGRDVEHGNPTHRSILDMTHTFRTEEDAKAAIALAQQAHREHEDVVKRAEDAANRARNLQGRAVTDAIARHSMDTVGLMVHLREQGYTPNDGSETEALLKRLGDRKRKGGL